jgi:hypothetical protein
MPQGNRPPRYLLQDLKDGERTTPNAERHPEFEGLRHQLLKWIATDPLVGMESDVLRRYDRSPQATPLSLAPLSRGRNGGR